MSHIKIISFLNEVNDCLPYFYWQHFVLTFLTVICVKILFQGCAINYIGIKANYPKSNYVFRPLSNADTCIPEAVEMLTAGLTDENLLKVTWHKAEISQKLNELGYQVFYNINNLSRFASPKLKETSWVVPKERLKPGDEVNLEVKAFNRKIAGPLSSSVDYKMPLKSKNTGIKIATD